MSAKPAGPLRRGAWFRLAAAVAAVGLIGAAAFFLWPRPHSPRPAPLPPLTPSPFLNTRPGVAYVGDERCADCHADCVESYHNHPMARSLFRAEDAPPLEKYGPDGADLFQDGPFHFQAVREGGRLIHREYCQDAHGNVVAEQREEVSYAVGSGSQSRSWLVGRDGFLFESPITWYRLDSRWQLSPGYADNPLHFTRRVEPLCLYCHCQEARPVADSVNRYQDPPFGQLAIGCERCHGPGQLHAAARERDDPPGDVDRTIVNPRRLAPALRDAVCEQCHLQGEDVVERRGRARTDYRPGLPLDEYVSIFVRPPEVRDARSIVGQDEQMHESACFVKSAGKFGCTSCHDPHRSPPADQKIAFYENRCRNCHGRSAPPADDVSVEAPDCSLPLPRRVAADGRKDCLACHMARNPSTTETHLAVTDHRLLRRPDQSRPSHSDYHPGDIPLTPFHGNRGGDAESERDLALAAVHLAEFPGRPGSGPVSAYLTERALPLLDRAAARAADDVPALEARGFALYDQGRLEDAQRALDDVLAQAPDRERALTWAAEVAAVRDRLDVTETYCRRLAAKYPDYPPNHEFLAWVLGKRKAWAEALPEAEAAVRGDPFKASAREMLITALLELGHSDRAQAEFDALGVIDPADQANYRPRFEEGMRQGK